MMFDTFQYWVFFAIALVAYWSLRDRPARWLLVASSYVFYGFWDWRFVALLVGSTLANYWLGRTIEAAEGPARKRWMVGAVVFNLTLLGFFKYCNFFIGTFAGLFGIDPQGLLLNIVLPVGISFFTFEGIAYAADIYRRELPAVKKPVDFAVFMSFFPHLIAGPIIRPHDFFPQLDARAEPRGEDRRWGLREILKGLIKKVAIADFFALIADAGFNGTQYQEMTVPAYAAVFAFSMQIYFDFSGYTDIARGCARLFGYRFPPNFARPYLAADIADFWRRWHISLSTWLRDYLYIPLGGNRYGEARTYLNLMIVMFLGGLWHGASWNYALWGVMHGGMLAVHRLWRGVVTRRGWKPVVDHASLRPFWIALTFVLATLAWVPFRASSFASTAQIFSALAQAPDLAFLAAHPAMWVVPLLCLGFCLVDREQRVQDWLVARAANAQFVALGVAGLLVLELFAQIDTKVPFVYFQF
jgi:D-alanyl-lipoteichoic acid acyltransferase DltB (MBOAT superfamily)